MSSIFACGHQRVLDASRCLTPFPSLHMIRPQPELFAGLVALAPMVSLEKVAKRVG